MNDRFQQWISRPETSMFSVKPNLERVTEKFRSSDAIEILAYSILLLRTNLHNPEVLRVGESMAKKHFVTNNRGIDAEQDLPADKLHAIYDRVAEIPIQNSARSV
ncbi:hypothetical protein D915_001740 [Fasciola hepatica]|uniref:SEC7 domain-containing protein n=1 Tax=Fasciola hepatica TaxID=6192 RepID=A0A4E0RJ12_FASHE|nr:hypothetical protein D915_001740 [Fasciola hepatica]